MCKLQNVLLLLFLCVSANACGQNTNNKLLKETMMTFIEDFADSLYSGIEKYPLEEQFNYQIYINTKNCYDLLVNDLLIGHDYGSVKQKIGYLANKAILKSGHQKLQVKFYPEYKNGRFIETLTNEDYLKITIERYIWNRDGWKDKETEILNYELPKMDMFGNDIDYSQKKELVIDLEFDAKVPYELKGWTDGVVFNKKDDHILKQKLVEKYNQRIEDFKEKEFKKIKKETVQRDYEQIQYYYLQKIKYIERFNSYYNEEKETYLPLNNYDIFFYGDGKLITLRKIDDENKGDGALIFETVDKNNETWITSLELFFYQPKGSDKLVLIR